MLLIYFILIMAFATLAPSIGLFYLKNRMKSLENTAHTLDDQQLAAHLMNGKIRLPAIPVDRQNRVFELIATYNNKI